MRKSYIHFSLPALTAGTTIQSAYVNLHDVENLITPSQASFPLGFAAAPWVTDAITWLNHAYPVDSQNIGRVGRVIVATLQDVATPLYTAARKRELVLAQQFPKRYQMRP